MGLSQIEIYTGWWFQTFGLIFHVIYGMPSFPLTNSYFSRWSKPPTRGYTSLYDFFKGPFLLQELDLY